MTLLLKSIALNLKNIWYLIKFIDVLEYSASLVAQRLRIHLPMQGYFPGSGRSPGEGHGNPLQHSRLGNPMDREACWATVHGVVKSWIWLSMHAHNCVHINVLSQTESLSRRVYGYSSLAKSIKICCHFCSLMRFTHDFVFFINSKIVLI